MYVDIVTHQTVDQRSLEMHRMIAEKLQQNPALLDIARQNLRRWLSSGTYSASNRVAVQEWEILLSGPLSKVLTILTAPDEQACRLRQSSPFTGILTQEERAQTFKSYESLRA